MQVNELRTQAQLFADRIGVLMNAVDVEQAAGTGSAAAQQRLTGFVVTYGRDIVRMIGALITATIDLEQQRNQSNQHIAVMQYGPQADPAAGAAFFARFPGPRQKDGSDFGYAARRRGLLRSPADDPEFVAWFQQRAAFSIYAAAVTDWCAGWDNARTDEAPDEDLPANPIPPLPIDPDRADDIRRMIDGQTRLDTGE